MADYDPRNDLIYTGIGSRETPPEIICRMKAIGQSLAVRGWTLRSGGAGGADSAFEDGCDAVNGTKEIYLPWKKFNKKDGYYHLSDQAFQLAEKIHPAWAACSDGARRLHARNTYQVLGASHDHPSKILICWTSDGVEKGGTRTALILAHQYKIPIINLGELPWKAMPATELVRKISDRFPRQIDFR